MSTDGVVIVGVDCATQPNKTGLVAASWQGEALRLKEALVGSTRNPPVEVLTRWVASAPDVLLALDAPLGWPRPLAEVLPGHKAGQFLSGKPGDLFSRTTDRWIEKTLQKRPLEVGANLIARTAHSALRLLDEVRQRTGRELPLVWEAEPFNGAGVVEVYPAATRIATGSPADPSSRRPLSHYLHGDLSGLGENAHLRDAAWCAVAGADFLAGRAEPPTDYDLAKQEGWIWVRGRAPGRSHG